MKQTILSLIGAFVMTFAFHDASSQCDEQVTTLSGTQVLGSTTVTVSSSGIVDENTSYCLSTFPYFIGYS